MASIVVMLCWNPVFWSGVDPPGAASHLYPEVSWLVSSQGSSEHQPEDDAAEVPKVGMPPLKLMWARSTRPNKKANN